MKLKKKNGFVIELMIVFMLVTFGFCTVIITYMGSLNSERKYGKSVIARQTELNQIGEYYLRAIEAGGTFPNGKETNYSAFTWMDDNKDGNVNESDETVKFFKSHRNYEFSDKMSTEYGDFQSFYEKLSVKRRLVVTSGGKDRMVVVVEEKYKSNNSSGYNILSWSVGDDLPVEEDGFTQDVTFNLLKKLWQFFGMVQNNFSGIRLGDLSDLFGFFDACFDDWQVTFH